MKRNAWVKGVVTVMLLVAVTYNYTGTIDTIGQQHINNSFNVASTTFVAARALNAVISVVQGTELAMVPLGVGMTLTPGQILDPVNDLVEQFSWVMLASTTAIGIEKVAMAISVWPVSKAIYSGFLVLTILFIWSGKVPIKYRVFWLKASVIVVFLRFSIPVVFIMNAQVYERFLGPQYNQSILVIKQTHKNIEHLGQDYQSIALEMQQQPSDDATLWNRVKNTLDIKGYVQLQLAKLKTQIEQRLIQLKTAVNNVVEHLLELMVVFILHAVIFPVAFLYGLYRLTHYLLSLELSNLFD